jgi:hypothetical protein
MHLLKNNNNNNNDLEASVIFIRHNRSFSDIAKIANFFFNEGSDWVCASTC